MARWRKMSTAPKDGTLILLCCAFDKPEIVVARYQETTHKGAFGRFCWDQPNDGGSIAEQIATHWMPLPNVPRSARSDRQHTSATATP